MQQVVVLLNEQDKKAIRSVIEELSNNRVDFPRLNTFLADGNYKYGKFMPEQRKEWRLLAAKEDTLNDKKNLRWIVGRSFAWLGTSRRLLRHFERTVDATLAVIYLAALRIMLNKINK